MNTMSRKQREIAEREGLILDVARTMLVERGYLGLTMDRIASATEYSKGTIYQHFQNKEEILAALAIESAERRVALFEKAATFPGRTRERLTAVGMAEELFVRLYPQHFQCERIVDAQSIREKTSDQRTQKLDHCEWGCMNVVLGLCRDAVAQSDLSYDDPETPQRIVLGLWSMSNGFHFMNDLEGNPLQTKLGLQDAPRALFLNYNRFLDGYGWKPLSTEWDYEASHTRIQNEVFADEYRRAYGS